ncbi:MAG TPA: MarR family transcriptional regulator, partial [Propionibacteriaceae bacterium]
MTGQPTRDEVDTIVEAWRRERPDLDLAPMEVLSRISRLARHLDRLRANAFSAHDLESWEFDVLAALRRTGPPYRLSPGQLLRETLVTSGTMTNRVDRLVERGLVTRQDHPNDRRGVLVELTDAGRDAVDAALAELIAAERQIMAVLDVAEHDQLTRSLRLLL